MTPNDDEVRLAIYREFARTGRPPSTDDLAAGSTWVGDVIEAAVERLVAARHLVPDADGALVLAHPFATRNFGFSVMGDRTLWWGGCAWDAFAIPHLVPAEPEVLVATTCPACGTPHAWTVTTAEPPAADQVAHFLTPMAHVWDDVVHACEHQRIFCDERCVADWLERTGARARRRLRPRDPLAPRLRVVRRTTRPRLPPTRAARGGRLLRERRTGRRVLGHAGLVSTALFPDGRLVRMSGRGGSWVLHVDLDQFIAAVEVLRHPELAGKPVIVGGRGDPTERAVVSTASYEAREFGVGSGMPLRIAARKAPDAVILPVDAEAYTAASERGHGDPARAARRHRAGARLGRGVRRRADRRPRGVRRGTLQAAVLERTRLHCSVGIGDTLVRAKVATGFGKPRGVFRLTADNWLEVMGDRPTIDLWGVGTKISRRLAALGISTVAELAAADDGSPRGRVRPADGSLVRPARPRRGRARRRRHALGGPRPQPRDDVPAGPRPSRRRSRQAVRELLAQVLEDVAAEGRPVVGLDAQGALRAVLHEDLHQEDRRDLRPRRRAGRDRWSWSGRSSPTGRSGCSACAPRWPCPTTPARATRRPAAAGDAGAAHSRRWTIRSVHIRGGDVDAHQRTPRRQAPVQAGSPRRRWKSITSAGDHLRTLQKGHRHGSADPQEPDRRHRMMSSEILDPIGNVARHGRRDAPAGPEFGRQRREMLHHCGVAELVERRFHGPRHDLAGGTDEHRRRRTRSIVAQGRDLHRRGGAPLRERLAVLEQRLGNVIAGHQLFTGVHDRHHTSRITPGHPARQPLDLLKAAGYMPGCDRERMPGPPTWVPDSPPNSPPSPALIRASLVVLML